LGPIVSALAARFSVILKPSEFPSATTNLNKTMISDIYPAHLITVVGPDANVKNAACWIARGRFLNGGQTCVATDHVYVHDSVKDDFVKALTAQVMRMYGANPIQSANLARITHARQWTRVAGLIADARANGAAVLTGGQTDEVALKIAPTVLLDVRDDMDAQQTEIFGPVPPVIRYSDLDKVNGKINDASIRLRFICSERVS
jgi:aldehyde dehydrogenase (NAD+)